MPTGGGGDGGAAAAERARQSAIKRGVQDIDAKFAGFNEPFYKRAGEDYTKTQMPKLMSDYQDTRNNLTYALARSGNLNSSTAINRNTSLQKTLASNESQIANQAKGQENELRGRVAQQRANLVGQLSASGDATTAGANALAQASQLRAPSVVQPLGNLFADWTNMYLAGQSAKASNRQANAWESMSANQQNQQNPSSYMVGDNR